MEKNNEQKFISIRFDKAHLSSIGERLYSQSLDLIREMVANAYDADATKVEIKVDGEDLVVNDNGSGMDRLGLEQYFTIGSPYKKANPLSPRFKRMRIGEFGIGKFAVLSLCSRFELFTSAEKYAATVIFDKNDFEKRADWSVPVVEHIPDGSNGTRVTLYRLKKSLSVFDLERYLTNIFPLHDRNFSIFLNDHKLQAKYIPGERFKISESTKFGIVKGEVVISSLTLAKEAVGIGIRVKGVLIKRETFGLEVGHDVSVRRLTGEVRADFLPITTDRSNFISDSAEYREFYRLLQKKLRRVVKHLQQTALSYQDKKAEKILSDALSMLKEAVKKNRDIFIMGDLPLFSRKKNKVEGTVAAESIIGMSLGKKPARADQAEDKDLKTALKEAVKNLKPHLRSRVRTLLRDDHRVVKKIKIGGAEFLVSFAHLGEEERESFVEGGIIFINRDHKLFKNLENRSDIIFYHLVRLVSQELVKFSQPKNLEIAFDWQGKLIKDAYLSIKNLDSKQ